MGSTSDIAGAIIEYVNTPDAMHAVAICGRWGSGKTHVWHEEIVPRLRDAKSKSHFVYVTMFGIKQPEQLDTQIAVQCFGKCGKLAKKYGRAFTSLSQCVNLKFKPEDWIPALLENRLNHGLVICFDDLERAIMDPQERLGYINRFVEHAGAHVVVLFDDDKLFKAESQTKDALEKIVGARYVLEQNADAVFTQILASQKLNDTVEKQMTASKDAVLYCFSQGGESNFRVLRQVITTLSRVFTLLDDPRGDISLPSHVTQSLALTVTPLVIEYANNRLTAEEIERLCGNYSFLYVNHGDTKPDEDKSPIEKAIERYNITSSVFTDEGCFISIAAIGHLVVRGFVDTGTLQEQVILQYQPANTEEDIVNRLRGGVFTHLTDSDFVNLINDIWHEVDRGGFAKAETWWQVFQGMEEFRQFGLIDITQEVLLQRFRNGVNAAIQSKILPPMNPFDVTHKLDRFPSKDYSDVDTFYAFLKTALIAEHRKSLKQKFRVVWEKEKDNFISVSKLLTGDDFHNMPLNELVSAEEFTKAIINSTCPNIYAFTSALRYRRRHVKPMPLNNNEAEWMRTVKTDIDAWRSKQNPLNKPSVVSMKWVSQNIDVFLTQEEQATT